MRFPFQKKKPNATRYSLIDPDISDSEGSEEESVLYQKQFGHVELNLIPRQPRVRQPKKASHLRFAYLCLAIILVLGSLITLGIFLIKNVLQDQNETYSAPSWSKTYRQFGGEGALRLFDVNGDGMDDIIFGAVGSSLQDDAMLVGGKTFDDLHRYCKIKGLEYPCIGKMFAVRGYDGKELWRFNTRSEVFLTVCNMDLNGDGLLDCIATGRQSTCVAFDPRKGEVLWTAEDDGLMAATWNIYQALALEDWDEDGVRDILIVNGGDPAKKEEDHDREAGRAIMLSGATGKVLGNRYLAMLDSKESYMSPTLYNSSDGSTPYVLFGSGGETVPGDLSAITTEDLCSYIMEDNKVNCPQYDGEPIWDHHVKDGSGFIQLYEGKIKGVMVPPVIVDVNKDGTKDLVVSVYDGAVILMDGKSLDTLWTANFSGMESYSSPAPGYFDDDDTLDFMVHWCEGAWDTYSGSNTTVISGKDGSIIWTLDSAFMQMTSDLTLKTNNNNQDMFVYRVQGRGSKFRWSNDGQINRADLKREKRHGEEGFKKPLGDINIEELKANDTWRETMFQIFKTHALTCMDDLDSFRGEVFLMDRTNSHNPLRILDMASVKYSYDITANNHHAEQDKLMRKLYPDDFKDGNISQGVKTHQSGGLALDDNDDVAAAADIDAGHVHDEDNGFEDDENSDHNDKNTDLERNEGNKISTPVPKSPIPDKGNVSDNMNSHADGGNRANDVDDDNDDDDASEKLCTVAFYDARTTGAIGDLDGDGLLDYVSVLELMKSQVDIAYSYISMDYDIVIHKVSFEKEVRDGTINAVPVMAETAIEDGRYMNKFDNQRRIFKPLQEQTWTAYLGKYGTSEV